MVLIGVSLFQPVNTTFVCNGVWYVHIAWMLYKTSVRELSLPLSPSKRSSLFLWHRKHRGRAAIDSQVVRVCD